MQRQLFFATGNDGKVRELRQLTAPYQAQILTLHDFPAFAMAQETGATFEENALIKARAAAAHSNLPTLADDSGLVVDALFGRPGVYSARYSGEGATEAANNEKLLRELAAVPAEERHCHYEAVLALVYPNGQEVTTRGRVEGMIIDEYRGQGGFGYDPIFYLPSYGKTMAELTPAEKNEISHRGRAFQAMLPYLIPLLTTEAL